MSARLAAALTPEDAAYLDGLSERLCAATDTPTATPTPAERPPVPPPFDRPCPGCAEWCGQCDVDEENPLD